MIDDEDYVEWTTPSRGLAPMVWHSLSCICLSCLMRDRSVTRAEWSREIRFDGRERERAHP